MLSLVIATILVATALGVWAERRFGERGPRLARRMLTFTLYGLLPPTVFFNLATADIPTEVGLSILLYYVGLSLTLTGAYLLCTRVLGVSRAATGAVLCCIMVPNSGYMGYPVTAALWGTDRLSQAVVWDILVAAPWLLIGAFSVGAAFGTKAGETPGDRVRAFFTRNPPFYAAVLAFLVPDAIVPDVLVDISRVIVVMILPIGFFALGSALAEEAEEGSFAFPPKFDKLVAMGVVGRMVLPPLLLALLAWPLIDVPETYLVLAGISTGVNPLVVSHVYGLDQRVTAGTIAWSTVFAILGLVAFAIVRAA